MKIAIEGPELTAVDFNAILDIFKQKNRRIQAVVMYIIIHVKKVYGIPGPPLCMKPWYVCIV